MHIPLREQTMEAMAMMMLGANAIMPHHDYRHDDTVKEDTFRIDITERMKLEMI